MTLYVLLVNAPYEGDTLHGVYTTPEAAETAKAQLSVTGGAEPWVCVVEADAAPRSRWIVDEVT
jgi:hypothetical protein